MATDRLFADLCRVLGRDDLIDDERFVAPAARSRHRDDLKVEIERVLTTRPAADWLVEMQHLPAGGVRTLDRALESPEVAERQMVREIPEGDHVLRVLGSPFKFAETALAEFRPPPLLGQHTDEVLSSVLGLDADAITRLRADGLVV
jgi:crotonobetainyl-CoA:carnitine CoA-transferase CaiB-like acyl-CoA transferase